MATDARTASAPGPAEATLGLTDAEAAARLARDGPNVLPAAERSSSLQRLAAQMVHFFAIMLWIAAGLAVLAGLPELGVAIAGVVLVNGVFAFVQEERADRAAEALQGLLPTRAMVLRGERVREVDAADLVVGDLVVLEAGDRISADLRIVEARRARVDVSTLTGESLPLALVEGGTALAGTFLVVGEARGVVVAAGGGTRMAGIARLAMRASTQPPIVAELRRVVRAISVIAVAVGIAFLGTSLLLGTPPSDGFLFGIGVTVALVPEALLPTVTLALAIGTQRMADRNALVRRLESVETLGSTTFVCTDKTGTLTRNELTAVAVWTPSGELAVEGRGYDPSEAIAAGGQPPAVAARELARAAAIASTGRVQRRDGRWLAVGDPVDAACDALARRLGEPGVGVLPVAFRVPFDPDRRRIAAVAERRVSVKGAPEQILALCGASAAAYAALEAMADRGLRVIAVAEGVATGAEDPDELERGLRFLGLIGLEDPPRVEVRAAIAACRTAGVGVALVTGDHPATALMIARETGIAGREAEALLGDDLPDDDEALGALIDRDGVVLARVDPESKLRIARSLRARGHVVAMTGDGVNDAPALREADIGVAMGLSGTDVAREAADLVLLDDDFATIVVAIEHGRGIYANVRRFLTYHLTDNVAEVAPFLVWALSGGSVPLALGVLQILALDLGTDALSATALGAEPPSRRVLQGPPDRGRLLDRVVAVRAFGVLGPTEALFSMGAFLATFLAAGWRPGDAFPGGEVALQASGAAFIAVVLGQKANAWACRSTTRWAGALRAGSNRLLVGAIAVELAVGLGALAIAPVADLLGQAPPMLAGWAVALLAIPAVIAADAAEKAVRLRSG
jgi:magnesium-transporting ATPase (P-type)